jgi:sugar phosphate isomerase/epimerase
MAKSGDYKIENLYEPGYASFNPSESLPYYLGKKNLISAGQMGGHTDPRTAAQLNELSQKLNIGTQVMELGTIDLPTFDTIPKQHWEEMRRKAKLAGAKLSLHAPIQEMDPAGFGQQGWDESKRELVERQLKDVIDKAAILDKEGNLPVTIHGSNTSGSTFKMVDGKKEYEMLVAVDRGTGQLVPMKNDERYQPQFGVSKVNFTPERQLESANFSQWDTEVDKVIFQKENADRLLSENFPVGKELFEHMQNLKSPQEKSDFFNALPTTQREVMMNLRTASAHLHDSELTVRTIFSKAYKYGNDEQKKQLEDLSKRYSKQLYGIDVKEGQKSLTPEQERTLIHTQSDLQNQSKAIHFLAEELREINPNMIQKVEDFSIEKGSETFANVALHAYKKYGAGAPVVSIENLYQGMGFSQGKDLKNLVEKSQETFVKKAVEDGMSKPEAERIAKKLIGVTFDVGHLNVSRGHGFDEKQLVKEAEEIRKHVKHVHLTDNFGYSDTHLPIGMGNVPVQALLEALGDEGERARKINEVGGWFQHFKTNPFQELLGAAGSQIYSTGDGPYWSQAGGFQQSYLEGYGQLLPDTHYQTFGAGFSQLPQSLGGSRGQTGQGRMGGGGF